MSPLAKIVRLRVDAWDTSRKAYEDVRVEELGNNRYKLLQSPGLVLGIAADDEFAVAADESIEVLKRGGNLCVQIFDDSGVSRIQSRVTGELATIGGRLDGVAGKELVYTVHVDVGFPTIERVLNRIVATFPTAEWVYGNVYDPRDGVTPLNWWLDSQRR